MITGRYQKQSDLGLVQVDVSLTGYNEFTVKFQEFIRRNGSEEPGAHWQLTAKLVHNCLVQDVCYYYLNLNFADDRLAVTEKGKNPFFRPGLVLGGAYNRADALVS